MSERDDSGRPWDARVLADRYQLVDFIARGGMAEVWEGHDRLLARRVAVKIPHPHLGRQEAFRKRFRREAVAAARLSHPNVVAIYDTGTDGEDNFIVMERVDGPSLRETLVPEQPVPVDKAVAIAGQVAGALAYAHRQGVIHRDIKPANILIGQDGTVKVADFGIAKAALGDDLTQTSTGLGTARYLAPEQIEGGTSPDRRADVYSLGVVLYEMVCGQPPFKADNEMALAFQHLRVEPPRPTGVCPAVPPWLEQVVLRAMAKAPDERFASADELRDALSRRTAWIGTDGAGGLHGGGVSGGGDQYPTAADSENGDTNPTSEEWSRPAAHVGATPRPFPVPGGAGEPGEWARPWAPTGAVGTTPTDRTGTEDGVGTRPEPSTAPERTTGPQDRRPTDTEVASPAGPGGWPTGSGRSPYVGAGQRLEGRPPPPSWSPPGWPPPQPGRSAPAKGRRPKRRLVPLVALVLAIAAAVVAGVLVSHLHNSSSSTNSSGGRGAQGSATGTTVPIVGATAFDPFGDHQEDNADLPHLYDGNPSTYWHTEFYSSRQFGGLKPGVGFVLDLGQSRKLQSLSLTSSTPEYDVSVYVSDSSGSQLSSWGQPVSSTLNAPPQAILPLRGRQGSYVLVWFTRLSPTDVVQIAEARLTS